MSFFPCADPAKVRAAMQHHCHTAFESQGQPRPQRALQSHQARAPISGWTSTTSSSEVMYATTVEANAWPMRDARGLGLQAGPYTTQAMYMPGGPIATAMDIPNSWTNNYDASATAMPSSHPPAASSHGAVGLYQYEIPSTTPAMPTSSWDSMPTAAPATNANTSISSLNLYNGEVSPGRSDYSTPMSANTASPYAHSDVMFQTANSPYIKTEEALDAGKPRGYSLPGYMTVDHSMIVNPVDVYHSPSLSMPEQQTQLAQQHLPLKPEDGGEFGRSPHHYEHPQHHSHDFYTRCAHSFQNTHCTPECEANDGSDKRPKRAFTTEATSTCSCERCGRLFGRSYNLKAHMETHNLHRDQPHACDYPGCPRRFVRRTDLQRHTKSVHDKARDHRCTYCNQGFARKDTLGRHMDDGCNKRPEVRKRSPKLRRASNTAKMRHASYKYHHQPQVTAGSDFSTYHHHHRAE